MWDRRDPNLPFRVYEFLRDRERGSDEDPKKRLGVGFTGDTRGSTQSFKGPPSENPTLLGGMLSGLELGGLETESLGDRVLPELPSV